MTKSEILNQIKELGVEPGMKIYVEASIEKIGALENGFQDLCDALNEAVLPGGSIIFVEKSSIEVDDGWSLLIGTDYADCAILKFAEKLCKKESKNNPEEFKLVSTAFENRFWGDEDAVRFGKIGNSPARLIYQKLFVDYAADWMFKNRK